MGIMDKLKSVKNFVTGGGAKIFLDVPQAQIGEPSTVTVRVAIGDAELSVARVYVIARSEERIDVVHRELEGGKVDSDRVRHEAETFRQEFVIAVPGNLEASSQHEWTGQITLPHGCQPTYQGPHARHVWHMQAGLEVTGNDPDSGWVEVLVR